MIGNGLSNKLDYQENSDFKNNDETKQYNLKVSYKNINFKSINLSETIDKEKNVYEKIAPGTSGNFNILLNSNENLKYKIIFDSINEKPKNLNFKATRNGKEIANVNTLEELSEKIDGYIRKGETINIIINWYWNFENNQETDMQDTKDSNNIRKYQFNISTIGEEII